MQNVYGDMLKAHFLVCVVECYRLLEESSACSMSMNSVKNYMV